MAKYRKKPVVIDAEIWDGRSDARIVEMMRARDCRNAISRQGRDLLIGTLEGVMTASPGDYVICGVKGELYPCKPDIFLATYEDAEADRG